MLPSFQEIQEKLFSFKSSSLFEEERQKFPNISVGNSPSGESERLKWLFTFAFVLKSEVSGGLHS